MLSQQHGHSATRRTVSIKNSSDTTRNRTRDLPACSSVPEPTAPPCTPFNYKYLLLYTKLYYYCYSISNYIIKWWDWDSNKNLDEKQCDTTVLAIHAYRVVVRFIQRMRRVSLTDMDRNGSRTCERDTHNMSYEYTNRSVVGRVKNRLKSPRYLPNYEIPAVPCQRLRRHPGMAQSVQ